MRQCSVFVLPSFYEGIPLVLVEAAACGCRLVSTRLPGVEKLLAPYLKKNLQLINLPGIYDMDKPIPKDLPTFVENFSDAIKISLQEAASDVVKKDINPSLEKFTWETIFKKVKKIWLELIESSK
ncbi:glycosyltransferase [candidate division KSB1 bacterium]|nr:glycosyltransferase [candidate division KSB1 bacterium]